MLYLANDKKSNKVLRIYVVKTTTGWNACISGKKFLTLDCPKSYVDEVLRSLIQKFGRLTLSNRFTDYDGKHIVHHMNEYYILDNDGKHVFIPELSEYSSKHRLEFTYNGRIKQTKPIMCPFGELPDYYENANPISENSNLWYAKDIDTDLWVCFDIANPETILSQNDERFFAISDVLSRNL